MRYFFTFTLFSIMLFSFNSCEEIDSLTEFKMEYDRTLTIDADTDISQPIDLNTEDIDTEAADKFESNRVSIEDIEEIVLVDMELSLLTPEAEDFSFVESAEVFISAEGLEDKSVGTVSDLADDIGDLIDVAVSGGDLKPYLVKEKFSLRLRTVAEEELTEDHEVNIRAVFSVDAKVLGQ